MKISKCIFLLVAGLVSWVFADRAWSEFYRYLDRNGNAHYVDDRDAAIGHVNDDWWLHQGGTLR